MLRALAFLLEHFLTAAVGLFLGLADGMSDLPIRDELARLKAERKRLGL